MRLHRICAAAALLLMPVSRADIRNCLCDVAQPATLDVRDCGLCKEAEKHPLEPGIVFVRDANPNKRNRWLVLPRIHRSGPQLLNDLTAEERTSYWRAAIAKGQQDWGDKWGVALNSAERRTQCHLHVHVGMLLPDAEDDHFVVVDRPEDIPVPANGGGIWIHAANGKIHAHVDEPAGELKLMR